MNITLKLQSNVESALSNALACKDLSRARDICNRYSLDFEALLQSQEVSSKKAVIRSRAFSSESRRNYVIQHMKKNTTFKVASLARLIAQDIDKYRSCERQNAQAIRNILREFAQDNRLSYTVKDDTVSVIFRKAE